MIVSIVAIFVAGYACIALESRLKIDKAAVALLMSAAVWSVLALSGRADVSSELMSHLGDTCQTLIFLIGAMTIVGMIDAHGGFSILTGRISTRRGHRLLWIIAVMTFFMSAVLDNMTTTIIMIMVMRRLVGSTHERLWFASVIIIAANCGGAWSPIGDVTTIMLWTGGNVGAVPLITRLLLPCAVALAIPAAVAMRRIGRGGGTVVAHIGSSTLPAGVTPALSRAVLIVGVAGLLFVPVFKSLTGLPPYMGMMLSLAVLWVMTEIVYARNRGRDSEQPNRVSRVVRTIDMPTILFFLGILLAVAGLQSAGVLSSAADFLNRAVHHVFPIATVVGLMSSIIDNVPLVAACMGMYPIADAAAVASAADPSYAAAFAHDGIFWHLLTYCAGVGGSILIIGSAAGVVAIGLEKIDFGWYLRHAALPALAGYAAGIAVIYLEYLLLG